MNIIKGNFKWSELLQKRGDTSFLIVHHAQAKICTVDDIHRWHQNNGWSGIGYNYFINKNGFIYEGRLEDMQGAHAKGYNNNSIGICLEGDFTQEILSMTQRDVLIELILDIRSRYPKIKLLRHMDVNQTSCPANIGWVGILADVEKRYIESLKNNSDSDKIDRLQNEIEKLKVSINNLKSDLNDAGFRVR